MPFQSPQQEAFLKHNHPEIYRRWLAEHGHFSYQTALKNKLKEKLRDRSSSTQS